MAAPAPDFYARAARLGHSAELLRGGQQVTSTIHAPSLEALRQLLDDGSHPTARHALAAHLVGRTPPTDPVTDASEGAILRRVQGYLYGDEALSDLDRGRVQHLFPLAITVISALDKPVTGEWVIDSPSPVVLNFGTLTMSDRACITVRSTVLHLTVDTLTHGSTPPQGRSDFNILGKTGATGRVGAEVGLGGEGSPGGAGGRGGTGTTGPTGSQGGPGADGAPSMTAVFTILKAITSTVPMSVFTQSGVGGTGGTGGTGGRGGTGGAGGAGWSSGCEGGDGGPGGSGGAGGVGGTGGTGGDGVPAAGDVLFRVPTGQTSKFLPYSSLPAPPGPGGAVGPGGSGGAGGGGGAAGKHSNAGPTGGRGADAASGGIGARGQRTGDPAHVDIVQG